MAARGAVLIGEPGSGKTQVLDAVVAGMPGRVIRVGNRLPEALTLGRVLRQVAPPGLDGVADEAEALLRCLAERVSDPDPPVLVVDDAHTATAGALAALGHVRGLGMIVLLAGEPELLAKLPDPGMDHPRGTETTLILMVGESGARPPVAPPRGAAVAVAGVRPRRLRRALWPAMGAVVLAGLAVWAFSGGEPPAAPVQEAVVVAAVPPVVVATICGGACGGAWAGCGCDSAGCRSSGAGQGSGSRCERGQARRISRRSSTGPGATPRR